MINTPSQLYRERWKLTATLVRSLERPMLFLSALWAVLLIIELTQGLSSSLQRLNDIIWVTFIAQFALEFLVAPRKGLYLRKQWITAVSLALPALRLLRLARFVRVARAARAVRGLRLARIISTINRAMRALARGFRRRGVGYLSLLTLLVALIGAAGMYQFEGEATTGAGFPDYGTALWWTAMLLTTMGSEYWPQTLEGRVLCLLLAMYAFAVFGYVTAAIAAYFIDTDQRRQEQVQG